MSALSGVRIAVLVFVVAILQVSAFSSIRIGGAGTGRPARHARAVALLRGSIAGAVAGFLAGLIVDIDDPRDARADLAPAHARRLLGRTLRRDDGPRAGPRASRRDRRRDRLRRARRLRPRLPARRPVAVRDLLVALPAAVIWNALLAYPVFGLVRRLIGTTERVERAREVELLV